MHAAFWKDLFTVPDAERLPAGEYERLVLRAKGLRGDAAWVIPAACALGAVVLWTVFVLAVSDMLRGALGAAWTGPLPVLGEPEPDLPTIRLVWRAVTVAAGAAIAAAAYCAVSWALLIRTMRRLANRTGCPDCGFSLMGLKVEAGVVVCPECGSRVVLAEHNLLPADLLPPRDARRPLAGAGPLGAYGGGHGRPRR